MSQKNTIQRLHFLLQSVGYITIAVLVYMNYKFNGLMGLISSVTVIILLCIIAKWVSRGAKYD